MIHNERSATTDRLYFEYESTAPIGCFSPPSNIYLSRLRTDYALDGIQPDKNGDFEHVLAILDWVNRRWDHDGVNTPSQNDPISILQEAATGKQFRCVEYAIVLAGVLAALGYPSRVLGLMTADVATRESGAGHVVTEVYLEQHQKWAMLDGQWNVAPLVADKPANAVELAKALAESPDQAGLTSISTTDQSYYFNWIKPYLYYFTARLGNIYGNAQNSPIIRLAPLNAIEPQVFQRSHPMQAALFTHNATMFYPRPVACDD
jgi:transglutaminase-like putative cysteine protease